jgi:hypothetical protein
MGPARLHREGFENNSTKLIFGLSKVAIWLPYYQVIEFLAARRGFKELAYEPSNYDLG